AAGGLSWMISSMIFSFLLPYSSLLTVRFPSILASDPRGVRKSGLCSPAAEAVFRNRQHELVLAPDQRQVERIEVADAAEEAVVARGLRIVAPVEQAAVEKHSHAVAEAEVEPPHPVALGHHHGTRQDGVAAQHDPLHLGEARQSRRLGVEAAPGARRVI